MVWREGAYPLGHGLTEVLHPVSHLSLAVGAELQAGPVSEDDLEGVGPIRGVGPPAATALLSPGPEEEGEMGGEGRAGTVRALGLAQGGRTPGLAPIPRAGGSRKLSKPLGLRKGLKLHPFLWDTFYFHYHQDPSRYLSMARQEGPIGS